MFGGIVDALLGSEPETTTVNTMGPQTEAGRQLETWLGQNYTPQMTGLANAPMSNVSYQGNSFNVMDPGVRQKANFLKNNLLGSHVAMQDARKGQTQGVSSGGSPGLFGSLAPAAMMWATAGFPGASGLKAAIPASGDLMGSDDLISGLFDSVSKGLV